MEEEKLNAAKIVSSAILGNDFKVVVVNDKAYPLSPPTIHKLAGAAYHLADVADSDMQVADVLRNPDIIKNIAKAVSCLLKGNLDLWEELSHGTVKELTDVLEAAYSLIDVMDFSRLLTLARNVSRLTAQQRL